jgi:arginyl-tRNA synthetase
MISLLNINSVLNKSFESRSLNDICEHLYKITNTYNNFYYQNRILTESNIKIRESWLTLTKIVYDNNCKMLKILGINIPERM